MKLRLVLSIAAFACGAVGAQAANDAGKRPVPVFKDPLEVPAPMSVRVPGGALVAITRVNQRLVAVGQRGAIVISDDGGQHWRQAAVPVSSDLTSVHFVSADKGWAGGHDGVILNTEDGGLSWRKQFDGKAAGAAAVAQYSERARAGDQVSERLLEDAKRLVEDGADKPFLDIRFVSPTKGYAVGAFNYAFATEDGGQQWKPIFERVENKDAMHLRALLSTGADLFIAGERGLLLRLDPATQRFLSMGRPYEGTYFGILSARPGHLMAYGLLGTAVESMDNGKSWTKTSTGLRASVTGGTVLADGRIVLVAQDGSAAVGEPGGAFKRAKVTCPAPYFGAERRLENEIVVIGASGACVQRVDVAG